MPIVRYPPSVPGPPSTSLWQVLPLRKVLPEGPRCRQQYGTTLLEVLVVVVIVAVLTALVIPSWRKTAMEQDISSDTRQLRQALTLARSTAIMTQLTVILCPSRDDRQCTDDWSAPLILREDGSSEILRHFPGSRNERLSFRGDGRPVRFQPNGRASGHNGTFVICAENDSGRELILSNFGRVREQPARPSSCSLNTSLD